VSLDDGAALFVEDTTTVRIGPTLTRTLIHISRE
jgi:hypothetical protein